MRMHVKLGVIFSIITVTLIAAFSLFSVVFERNSLYQSSEETLRAVGSRIVSRFDDSVEMMDQTLKNLIANADFMDAMAVLTYLEPTDEASTSVLLESRSLVANTLLRDSMNQDYHRVNAFNDRGVFYSSLISPHTEDDFPGDAAGDILCQLQWVSSADAAPFEPLLLAPYNDPWSANKGARVFGLVRAVVWMGRPCGYLEVQSDVERLDQIFSPEDLDGVRICAFINDTEPIYESDPGVIETALACLSGEDDAERAHLYEYTFVSPETGLTLYIAQDTHIWNEVLLARLAQFAVFEAIALLCTIAVTFLVSHQQTQSIRALEGAMDQVCFEHAAISPNVVRLDKKNEIYHIQQTFNAVIERLNVAIRDEMQARDLHLRAQLNALQAQINPHFIYNTLNVITAKSLEHNAPDIANICSQFSDMLRYSIASQEQIVELSQEVEHVANYLELMKARYEDRLHYQIDIPEPLLHARLPRLTLQPLAENCFVHGFQTRLQNMRIVIAAEQTRQGLRLSVHDNGDGFPLDVLQRMHSFLEQLPVHPQLRDEDIGSRGSIGLANTFTRLYLFCNGKMHFSLYNDDGAVVELLFLTKGGQTDVSRDPGR